MKNEIYSINVNGKDNPAYTCGHCSSIIMVNPRRKERRTCLSCGRWLCGTNELCNSGCTPIHELAKDHFEGAGEFGKYVPALMKGITTL